MMCTTCRDAHNTLDLGWYFSIHPYILYFELHGMEANTISNEANFSYF